MIERDRVAVWRPGEVVDREIGARGQPPRLPLPFVLDLDHPQVGHPEGCVLHREVAVVLFPRLHFLAHWIGGGESDRSPVR